MSTILLNPPARRIREGGGDVLEFDTITPTKLLARHATDPKIEGVDGGAGSLGPFEWLQTTVLGSDDDDIPITGLDGDTDVTYLFVIRLVKGASGLVTYYLQPNGSGSNLMDRAMFVYGAAATTTSLRLLVTGSGVGVTPIIETVFYAKSGITRHCLTKGVELGGDDNSYPTLLGGSWKDDSSNLVSVNLHADAANGFKTGTEVVVYRRING